MRAQPILQQKHPVTHPKPQKSDVTNHLGERRTQVALACAGAGGQTTQQQDVLDIHCGTGQQILRWLGYAACTRLAHKRGKASDAASLAAAHQR